MSGVVVIQSDREAWIKLDDLDGSWADACRNGAYDHTVGVQSFAAHRTSATQELVNALSEAEVQIVEMYDAACPHGRYDGENRFADGDPVVQHIREVLAKHGAAK
ncbi:MAG: hypothetical protein ABW043_16940 [Devosia sp.]|uniref:hypothetical protein n=1 Tax=Devosia sp. TaxID=1871048 RepID=UPI0033943ACC